MSGRHSPSDQPDAATAAYRRAASGDASAFADFYDLTSARVFGVVERVVRNRAIAEEVAQEVFVELWRLAPRFEADRGSAATWASTIAHRRAVDRVRSEQARRNREDRDPEPMVDLSDRMADDVAERLDNERVERALATLTDDQRAVVVAAYFDGLSYRQVATHLGLPEGTVKSRIRKGLARLRDELEVMP